MATWIFVGIVLATLVAITSACSPNAIMAGELRVTDGGYTGYYPVAVSGGNNGLVWLNESTINLKHGARAYIGQSCDNYYTPSTLKPFDFFGRTLSFTVDLHQAGCGCNAAFYMVRMPGAGPSQCGDYYCDANNVCGQSCPEMDVLEANTRAVQVTPHKCNDPTGGVYYGCDGGGCAKNSYKINGGSFGPNSGYIIDTTQPFDVSSQYLTANGNLDSIITTFSQYGKSFQITHSNNDCGYGYLSSLTDSIKGMAIVMSYWGDSGSTMSWLDVPPCSISENCNTNSYVSFSNIKVY